VKSSHDRSTGIAAPRRWNTDVLHEARKRWAPMSGEVRVAVEMALLHLGRPR